MACFYGKIIYQRQAVEMGNYIGCGLCLITYAMVRMDLISIFFFERPFSSTVWRFFFWKNQIGRGPLNLVDEIDWASSNEVVYLPRMLFLRVR